MEGQWGFLLPPTAHVGLPSQPVVLEDGTRGQWVPRDAAVSWAQDSEEPAAEAICRWREILLESLEHGVPIPAISYHPGGVRVGWRLLRHRGVLSRMASAVGPFPEGASGGDDGTERYVRRFLDDWADAYIRETARRLEIRQAIAGSLGRRLMSRLVRPPALWELNREEAEDVTAVLAEWASGAAKHVRAVKWEPDQVLTLRVSGAAQGEGLKIELVTGNRDVGAALVDQVMQWAERWVPWNRAVARGGIEPLWLTQEEAREFWEQELPFLADRGVQVEFPKGWRRHKLQATGVIREDSPGVGGVLDQEGLCQVDWTVALDDQSIGPEEVKRLAEARASVVRLGSQWVVVDARMIEAAQMIYDRISRGSVRMDDVVRLDVDETAGAVRLAAGTRLRKMLQDLRQPEPLPLPIAGFEGVLRPYQVDGVGWLWQRMRHGLGALLADDMGLGKTVEVIAALTHHRNVQGWSRPVLLVSPLSVVGNWEREWARFAPGMAIGVHVGPGRAGGHRFAAWAERYQVILTTYEVLARDHEVLAAERWEGIVVDEAQHLKNHRTKRARSLRRLTSAWRIALTGTPVENRLLDLWSEMDFLNPGYLGHEAEFRRRVEYPIVKAHDAEVMARLKRLVEPFVLRRVKTDPAILPDLPAKVEIKEWVGLTREQAGLYQAIVDRLLTEMKNRPENARTMGRRGLILSALTQLKQVVNHPASFMGGNEILKGRSGKLARLEEVLEEILDNRDRVVLFTQYVAMAELLRPYLARRFHIPVGYLHGGLGKRERDQVLDRFGETGGPPLLIASLKAGGVGLNLSQAQHVIHYDRWWNPAVEDQATDRVWRMGQSRLVTVHKLIARGTLEERIDRLIEAKRVISQAVVAQTGSDNWITEMSDEQIGELVRLGEGVWSDL